MNERPDDAHRRDEADERRQAAMLAISQERRNRPLALPLIAGALLAAATIFSLVAFSQLRAARQSYDFQRQRAGELLEVASSIERARAQSRRGPAGERYAPERNLLTKLQGVSERVGLEQPPSLNPQNMQRFEADSPLARRPVEVAITGATAEQGLRWIDMARQEIPGLHTTRIELRPTSTGWTFRITLARWEMSP